MAGNGLLNLGMRLDRVPGLTINPAEVNGLIERDGQCGEYRRALRCPCARLETDSARSDCPVCRGMGWRYPAALRRTTMALSGSRDGTHRYGVPSDQQDGTMMATFLTSEYVPAKHDLWLPEGEVHSVSEVRWYRQVTYAPVVMSSLDQAMGRTPTRPSYAPSEELGERLLYPEVSRVDSVSWFTSPDDPKRQIIDGIEGQDWRLQDGSIFFIEGGRRPPPGAAYAVSYQGPACYMIFEHIPPMRYMPGNVMPYRARLGRLDRVGGTDLR